MNPRSSGVALVFVLWLMVLLSAVALEMAFRGHLRVQVTASTGETAKAFYLARAGIEQSLANLAETAELDLDTETQEREDEEQFVNVPFGEGSYTLYAGMDETGEPRYGLADEAAKLNINTADAAVLQKVPMLTPDIVGSLDNVRKRQPFQDIKDLLMFEGVDMLLLFGEDVNENGLLDANEDDGDETWPPDNGDGMLDCGWSAMLTTWSASRNVSSDGQERVNLNDADADEITKAVSEIDTQHADSIVARREQGELGSVLDLLDVEMVEKVEASNEQQQQQQNGQQNQPPPENQNNEQNGKQSNGGDKKEGKNDKDSKDNKDGKNGNNGQESKEGEQNSEQEEKKSGEKPKYTYKSTGQKAFDQDSLKRIADRLTTSDDEVQTGLVNINTASMEVLSCLPGLDESLAQSIVMARDGRAGGFPSTMDLLDVSGMTVDILKQFYGLVATRSDVFTARSIGVLRGGAVRANVSAVLDRTESNVRIRYWQEHD
ncbi:MAG: helix-hairpin-helix domain-containing protein [FCB group bacterium]|jgi:DNA uptake protein ComE-like DNA-binding protein|nr:helix-hairpin-helix domain-containing protein [FCB group bacterium]